MAEQSSTVAAFRALVMLVCLILIPVAAFCGGSFPAVVKAIQSGRWPTLADFRGPTGPASREATEAPKFVPRTAGPAWGTDPNIPGPSTVYGRGPGSQAETARSPVVGVNYDAPITPSRTETGPLTGFPQSRDSAVGSTQRLSPLPAGPGNLLSLEHSATAGHAGALVSLPGASGTSPSDNQLKDVVGRLQKLGVTYFVLEPCGNEKREFRFFCKVSLGGNPRVTQPFWCFDSDPLRAMTRVLKQVEDWQVGGG